MTQDHLSDALLLAEHDVWKALVAGDEAADARALDDDFLGVYPTGFAGKNDHVAQLSGGPTVEAYRLSDVRVVACGPDHALLVYRADYIRPGATIEEAMYVSSLWRHRDGDWINLFSQDTPASGKEVP